MKINNKLKYLIILIVFVLSFFIFKQNDSFAIYKESYNTKLYLTVLDPATNYTVTLEYHDSNNTIDTRNVAVGQPVGALPSPSKDGYNFDGWFTLASGGTQINENTLVTSNITYHAQYTKIVCKMATSLHSYNSNNFGIIPNSTTIATGFAYDCDVNGDDVFDATTERFYYLLTDNSGIASLIYYNNTHYDSDLGVTVPMCKADGVLYNDNRLNYEAPTAAAAELPSSTQWSNVELHNLPRQIVNQEGGTTTNNGNTIETFSYPGKSSRFATTQEIVEACNITQNINTYKQADELNACTFLLENTTQHGDCRSNYWLETPQGGANYASSNAVFRLRGNGYLETAALRQSDLTLGHSAVRPVIEVPVKALEKYVDPVVTTYTVTFDTDGGSAVSPITVDAGDVIDPLPVPTKNGHILLGWYQDDQLTIPFTNSTPVNSDLTLYAKWELGDYVASVNGTYYATLAEAIDAVPTGKVKTTVNILKDITLTESIEIPNTKWVELNGSSYTISGNDISITNNGKLDIISGTITSTATNANNIITNVSGATLNISGGTINANGTVSKPNSIISNPSGATVNISGGTLNNNSSVGTVDHTIAVNNGTFNITGGTLNTYGQSASINHNAGTLTMSSGEIHAHGTTKGQAIYIAGGTVNISGDAYLTNVSIANNTNSRSTVDNNGGTLNIRGGTIVSQEFVAVETRKTGKTTNIGTNDSAIYISDPVLRGKEYGLKRTDGTVNVYDGLFESLDNQTAVDGTIVTPNGINFTDSTIDVDGVTYTSTYLLAPAKTIRFDANGGTVDSQNYVDVTIDNGHAIGNDMPNDPIKTDYYFDGWYNNDTQITSSTVVVSSYTALARWVQDFTNGTVPTALSVAVNDSENIVITGSNLEDVTYSSSDPTKATVDADGTVHGVAVGSTTITITGTKSGSTSTVTVTVTPEVFTVTFYDAESGNVLDTQSVVDGDTIDTHMASNPTDTNLVFDHWYLEGSPLVQVTSATVVTGNINVIASWKEKVTYATLTTSPSPFEIVVGNTGQITLSAHDQGNTVEGATYSSDDTSVATVDANGEVTAVAVGSATITITGSLSNTPRTVEVTVIAVIPEYTVTFKDGNTVLATPTVLSGNTISGNMPNTPTQTNYIFDHWYLEGSPLVYVTSETVVTGDMTVQAAWKEKVSIALVSPSSITIAVGETATITVDPSVSGEEVENYTFSSSDDSYATVDSSGVVTGVAIGSATITITGTSAENQPVSVTVISPNSTHTVSFMKEENDNVAFDTMTVTHNNELGSLPSTKPTKTGYAFAGWYTLPDPNGVKITEAIQISGDVTFYAHWDKLICKKATALHSSSGTDIGTLPGNNNPSGGFAYDCDVNGNDVIDTLNDSGVNSDSIERFYYLATDNNGYAALLFWNNTHQDNGLQYICGADGLVYSSTPTSGPTGSELPTTSQWPNVSLHSTPRQLYNESGTTAFGNDTLSTTSYSGKAARFATTQEIEAATGLTAVAMETANSMLSYKYLFENLKVLPTLGGSSCRSNYWLETPKADGENEFRIDGDTGHYKLGYAKGGSGKTSATRPVIEVPTNLIEGFPVMYTVTFNSMGGSSVASRSVADGAQVGTLPTAPTKADNYFAGWYTTTNYSTEVTSSRVVTDNVEYFAKWIPTVNQATISPSPVNVNISGTETLTITGPNGMESYTLASGDTSIATVNSNGVVTGVSEGTTTITITGSTSGAVINVTVYVGGHNLTFDLNDGVSDPITIHVNDNVAIGNLMPNDPTKTGYTFDAWFLMDGNNMTNTMVDSTRVITQDETYKASYYESTDVAAIGHTYYTTLQLAIDDVPKTEVETEIRLVNNITNPTGQTIVAKHQYVRLNGGNYTITAGNATTNQLMLNNGTLRIVSGTYTCGVSTLATIQNGTGATMYVDGGTIINTGDRGAIYNEGALTITGGEMTSSTGVRSTVRNTNNSTSFIMYGGTITQTASAYTADGRDNGKGAVKIPTGKTATITGGTIISNSTNSAAIDNASTSLVIGTKNDSYNVTHPVIQGEQYGIESSVTYSIYDGIIKGKTNSRAVNDFAKITGTEDNSTKQEGTEGNYYTLYYILSSSAKYRINLGLNGGTNSQSPDYREFDLEEVITASDLPTPTNGIYTFGGWYTDSNATTSPVVFPYTIPNQTGNTTFYAKWTYASSNVPVMHNVLGQAMQSYFSNVSTWVAADANDSSNEDPTIAPPQTRSAAQSYNNGNGYDNGHTLFKNSISSVFTTNSCSSCQADNNCTNPSSGTRCDYPSGYSIGITDPVTIYLYENGQKTNTVASYITVENGVMYNMIPGVSYYWELNSDSNVYGIVTAQSGTRRTLKTDVRNLRDLGGMSVTYTNSQNQTVTGTIDYGRLYRGAQITSSQGVTDLEKLGVTREIDLRPDSEGGGNSNSSIRMTNFDIGTKNSHTDISMTNYIVNPEATTFITTAHLNEYKAVKKALREVMKYIVNDGVNPGDNIFFHCTIGTDRTGTLAYFLEGLLGVSEEDRLRDYELTYFFGLTNRTRFHDSVTWSDTNPRFFAMYRSYPTNADIYTYYKYFDVRDNQNEISDDDLLDAFREVMIVNKSVS